LDCVFDIQFSVWRILFFLHLLAYVLHMGLKTCAYFLFAILFFFGNLSVLTRKVFVLLIVFPRNNFVLLLNQVCLLIPHQLLLCLEISQLLVELALQRLHD
jgi:hypothetical protein